MRNSRSILSESIQLAPEVPLVWWSTLRAILQALSIVPGTWHVHMTP